MATEHTPGPWNDAAQEEPWTLGDAVTAAADGTTLDHVEVFVPVFGADESLVALVPYGNGEPQDATLSLIAAAPDLLAAAQRFLAATTAEDSHWALVALEESVAKATGND